MNEPECICYKSLDCPAHPGTPPEPWDAVIVLTPGPGQSQIRVEKDSREEAVRFAQGAVGYAYARGAEGRLEFYPAHRVALAIAVPKGADVELDSPPSRMGAIVQ